MPREKLENTLRELHETLQQSQEVDPDDAALLRTLDDDIRRLLAEEGDAGPHGLVERAEALAARFRADHPALENTYGGRNLPTDSGETAAERKHGVG